MQYSPTLKVAIEEIKQILLKHNIVKDIARTFKIPIDTVRLLIVNWALDDQKTFYKLL